MENAFKKLTGVDWPLTQPITCNGCFPLPKERLITYLKFKKQGLRESFCTPKVAHGVKWFSTNGDIPCEKCNIIVWGFQHPSNLCSYLCALYFSEEGDISSGKCKIIMPVYRYKCIYRIAQ